MGLKKCKKCGIQVSNTAESCPQCGAKVKSNACLNRLFKIFLGLLFAFFLLVLVAYYIGKTDKTKNGKREVEKNLNSSDNEENDDIGFDFNKSKLLPSLLSDFDSCYYWATLIASLDGLELENAHSNGSKYYNSAYQKYLDFQKETNYELPKNKSEVLNQAMTLYGQIFSNKYVLVSNYKTEIEFVKENLKGYPKVESQIEKDYDSGAIRMIVSSGTRKEIGLPKKGAWCLVEIEGGDRVVLEGNFPNNGYGKFDIYKNQLPIYLGYTKIMIVDNIGISSSGIHLIFKKCEKD